MSTEMTARKLASLGLQDSSVGDSIDIELGGSDDGVAKGFVATENPVDTEMFQAMETTFLDVGPADAMGFRIAVADDWPQLLRIWTPGPDFDVRPDSADGVHHTDDEEFYIESDAIDGPVAIIRDGEGIVLEQRDHRLQVTQLVRLAPALTHDASLDSPLKEWLDDSLESWLVDIARSKLERRDMWQEFVALGLVYRLKRPRSSEDAAEMVESLLEGRRSLDDFDRELQWANQLDDVVVERIIARALTAIEHLEERLVELAEAFDNGAIILRREVLDVAHRRDDISSALALLKNNASTVRLQAALRDVDELGHRFIEACRSEFDITDDQRLRHASVTDPEGWWVQLAVDETP